MKYILKMVYNTDKKISFEIMIHFCLLLYYIELILLTCFICLIAKF